MRISWFAMPEMYFSEKKIKTVFILRVKNYLNSEYKMRANEGRKP